MKFFLLLSIFVTIIYNKSNAQIIDEKKIQDYRDSLNSIRDLYNGKLPRHYVTDIIFDQTVKSFQQKISGTLIKDGKVMARSAVVDDKSVTVNYSFPMIKNMVSLQPTVSGSSKDKVVDVFSSGKYKRTISAGLNFNVFLPSFSGNYWNSNKKKLWNKLKVFDNDPPDIYSRMINELIANWPDCQNSLASDLTLDQREIQDQDLVVHRVSSPCLVEQLTNDAKIIDLIKPFLEKKIDLDDLSELQQLVTYLDIVDNKYKVVDAIRRKKLTELLDSIQVAAPWNGFHYIWLTGSLKYNTEVQPQYNEKIPDELYTEDYHHNFFSSSLSFNIMWVNKIKKNTYWFAPTVQLSNQRKFESTNLTTIQKQINFIEGADTIKRTKTSSFYKELPNRNWSCVLETPFVVYHPESKTGWDFAIGTKFSEKIDDLYFRIGFYIPVNTDADNVVTIEPLIKFNNLNKSNMVFLQEQFSFGFSVSVSIAKFLSQ